MADISIDEIIEYENQIIAEIKRNQIERQNIELSFAIIVDELDQRLFYGGIGVEEIDKLQKLKNHIYSFYKKYYDDNQTDCRPENEYLYHRVCIIIKELKEVRKQNLSARVKSPYEFINKNASIIPLVLANSEDKKMKPRGRVGVITLCQFHNEKTASLHVSNLNNIAKCYACGTYVKPIEYIKKYENLSTMEAMSLLAKVFCLHFPGTKAPVDKDLVIKYRRSLLGVEYKQLLKAMEEHYSKVNNYSDNQKEFIESKIYESYGVIDRVQRKELKCYQKSKPDVRKLTYKMPEFNEE